MDRSRDHPWPRTLHLLHSPSLESMSEQRCPYNAYSSVEVGQLTNSPPLPVSVTPQKYVVFSPCRETSSSIL